MRKKSASEKRGIITALSVIAAVAAVLLLNAVVAKLPKTVTKIDLTDNGSFKLTRQTEDIANGLSGDVDLYLVCDTSSEPADIKYIKQLLERYESLTPKIKVHVIDPALEPDFTTRYTSVEVENGSVIADGPRRSKVVAYSDIFAMDRATLAQTGKVDVNFKGEEAITAALSFVDSDAVPRVYVTQGHGEKVPDDGVLKSVWAENYEIEELSLLSVEKIPDDVSCVIMSAPESDISAREAEILQNYLDRGGSFYLLTTYGNAETPNLYGIMAGYGLSLEKGFVIDSDPNYCFAGRPYYVMPDNNYHTVTAPLYANGLRVLLRMPQGINISSDLPEGVEATALLFSSKSSISKVSEDVKTLEKEEGDASGPFSLGVAAQKGESRVVWFGSADLVVDEIDAYVSGSNRDMFINALAWLSDWEQTISIRSTAVNASKLAPTDLQRSVWGIVYPALLMVVILCVGAVVYIRRRKR
ncbi:MAG: GldG family protein [Clostridia bacterium]|nr:GldG family protein [Clostridia bacterium]